MNYQQIKKHIYSLAVAAALILISSLAISSTAQAQNRDWGYGRWDDRQRDNRDYNRDRDYDRGRDSDRYGRDDWRNRGGYGDSRYRREVEKGYRDGLDRGQKDAKTNRIPTPNNSSHYRDGNSAYREGFRRGYEQGYRQYARRGRW